MVEGLKHKKNKGSYLFPFVGSRELFQIFLAIELIIFSKQKFTATEKSFPWFLKMKNKKNHVATLCNSQIFENS